jgi:hypothetical protein
MTAKERMMDAVRNLPDDATIAVAIHRLHLLDKIDRSLAEEAAGELLTQDDMRRRMASCLTPR